MACQSTTNESFMRSIVFLILLTNASASNGQEWSAVVEKARGAGLRPGVISRLDEHLVKHVPGAFDKEKVEKESRAAIDRFVKAWNTADVPTFRQVLHFPFVTFSLTGKTVIYQKPKDYSPDFEKLKQGRWDHSTFDKIEPLSILPDKAHYQVTFSRRTKSGDAYVVGEVIYLAVKRDGRWAVCAKSLLGHQVKIKQ